MVGKYEYWELIGMKRDGRTGQDTLFMQMSRGSKHMALWS